MKSPRHGGESQGMLEPRHAATPAESSFLSVQRKIFSKFFRSGGSQVKNVSDGLACSYRTELRVSNPRGSVNALLISNDERNDGCAHETAPFGT